MIKLLNKKMRKFHQPLNKIAKILQHKIFRKICLDKIVNNQTKKLNSNNKFNNSKNLHKFKIMSKYKINKIVNK